MYSKKACAVVLFLAPVFFWPERMAADDAAVVQIGAVELKELVDLAESGSAVAQAELGNRYIAGKGVLKNEKTAFGWYEKAASAGHVKAQFQVGLMYKEGLGVKKNAVKAFEWCLKSATNGDSAAQCEVGIMYWYGLGVGESREESRGWFLKASDQGDAHGDFLLGLWIMQSDRVNSEYKSAITYFRGHFKTPSSIPSGRRDERSLQRDGHVFHGVQAGGAGIEAS